MKSLSAPLSLIACILLMDVANVQTGPANQAKITAVRAKTIQIDKGLASYKKVRKDNADPQSTEGNLIMEYFDHGMIKKMTTTYYMETGRTAEICYFDQGLPIFYYSRYQQYDRPIYVKKSKVASTKETRYYFDRGSIFAAIPANASSLEHLTNEIRTEIKRQLSL